MEIWNRAAFVLLWAAIGTGIVMAILYALFFYLYWQMSTWFRAEFSHLAIGTELTEEDQARWQASLEKKRTRGIYRFCEVAIVLIGLPGMVIRSRALVETGISGRTIMKCNAIAWFVLLVAILTVREFH